MSAFDPKRTWNDAQIKLSSLRAIRTFGVERLELGAVQAGTTAVDRQTDPGLQICEMAVTFRELRQQLLIELELYPWLDHVDAILVKDAAAQHDPPAVVAVLNWTLLNKS